MTAEHSTDRRDRSAYSKARRLAQRDLLTPEEKAKKAAYKKEWHEANKARLKIERAEYHKAYRAANAIAGKAWREANRDSLKAYNAARYIEKRDEMRAAHALYYKTNADVLKARARKWELDNPERKRELAGKYRERNREKIKEISRIDWQRHNAKRKSAKVAYRAAHPAEGAHHCRLRQTRKMQATPSWADLTAIKAVYRQAVALRKATGEAWHVDHDIPLKHPLVCGLHVPANLRVIPARENQSKGNGFRKLPMLSGQI